MTKLTALELHGFKSFADRTRFEFPAGVSAVVGPNGSGKSNVVDAIKWVLGEQSVRSLRGKEATDVIFAGSAARKPLNAAEVSLVFDNTDRLLLVDSDEVCIMRRLYRSGESEYLINGSVSRLRDIRELLSGTGAGTEAYSVIEQGRVDALLVASGRDRRGVFEEAAGITRFRTRRTDALRRLERTEQHRQRLADIAGEVQGRLETVRHQAAKARRWQRMTDRLRCLRVVAARADLEEIDAAVQEAEARLIAARDEEQETLQRIEASTQQLTAVDEQLACHLPHLTSARRQVTLDLEQAAATAARLEPLGIRRREAEQELSAVGDAATEARRHEQQATIQLAHCHQLAEDAQAHVIAVASRLAACEQQAEGSHRDAASTKDALAAAHRHRDGLRYRHQQAESGAEREREKMEQAQQAIVACRDAVDAARRQEAMLQETEATLDGTLTVLESRRAGLLAEAEQLEARSEHLAAALGTAWNTLAERKGRLEAIRDRHSLLSDLIARGEGLSEATRSLVAGSGNGMTGFLGLAADLVEADAELAPLVDLVLREDSVVVQSLDDLLRWHGTLTGPREDRGGRVHFVALSPGARPTSFDPSGAPGLVGRLDQLLAADRASTAGFETPQLCPITTRLLGHVWVVDTLAAARPLLADAPSETLFVSRDGNSLSAAGTVEMGGARPGSGGVARRAELRTLLSRQDQLRVEVDEATVAIDTLHEEQGLVEQQQRHNRLRREEVAASIAATRSEQSRIVREQEANARQRLAAEATVQDAETRAIAASQGVQAAEAATQAIDAELRAADRAIETIEQSLNDLTRSRGEVLAELARGREDHDAALRDVSEAQAKAAAQAIAVAAAERNRTEAETRFKERAVRLRSLELDWLRASAQRSEAAWRAAESGRLLAACQRTYDRLTEEQRQITSALDTARAGAAAVAESIHAAELAAGEARHRRARIVDRIRDEYDLTLDTNTPPPIAVDADGQPIEVPPERETLDREVEDLRRKIASMTSVNLEALVEADELAARLAGLESQLHDVSEAKRSIEQLISRLDDESRRLLGETIETVREHFRDLFERLFGGGQADIVVEPDVDLLEAAVEIVARPPGKEPRNISLLSGGEKTMTCVALLLAIFRSRPSPFCVLDEVDAALDEANVDRFAGVLRDFLSATQFIVVTHSKKTMASATTLYGVTMEESGVSKRVAVRFEAEAAARQTTRQAA